MTKRNTKAPTAGDALVTGILADMAEHHLAPDARESALLEKARAAADKIEQLEAAVEKSGLTYVDRGGVTRPSPLLAEIRSTTLVLTRCVAPIQMEPEKVTKNPNKVRAGQASWAARSAHGNLRGAIAKG
ncbi:hypothetical protein [Mycobacterium sp.]|uniref:hypothetical protein n=1 Tax=Mycobacterium sp. TaxID=1785 RepID=UPI003F9AC821